MDPAARPGHSNAPSTAFRGIVLCGFPDTPGHLEEHLVVVDVKDRAVFVGDPQQDEWQVFPDRIFVPLAQVTQAGNTVRLQGNDKAGPSVDVHFNFKADASTFLAAVNMASVDAWDNFDGGMQAQERNPVGAGARPPAQPSEFPAPSGRNLRSAGAEAVNGDDSRARDAPSGVPSMAGPGASIRAQMPDLPAAAALPQKPAEPATLELGFAGRAPDTAPAQERTDAAPARERTLAEGADGAHQLKSALLKALDKKLSTEIDQREMAAYHLSTKTVAHTLKNDSENLLVIDQNTLLSVVVSDFEQCHHLLYLDERGAGSVISRAEFVARLVITSTSKRTFGEWLHEALPDHGLETFPQLPSVSNDETLVNALEMMLDTGAREYCVRDSSHKIIGIITYEQIIDHALNDFVAERVLRERPSAGANTTKLPIRFATAYDPYEGWGAFRTGAASWVTSGVTETAVILLTFVDIFASVVDSIVFNPCITCSEQWDTPNLEFKGKSYDFTSEEQCISDLMLYDCDAAGTLQHPMNAFTGVILIIFVCESLTRIYAFRMSMFNSFLDVLDFCIVYASLATFIWMIVAAGSKIVRKIVTVGRVMRFLRLIRMFNKLRRAFMVDGLRLRKDGFNLDLTYVTNNVIAMPLPGQGLEATQYNDIADVARFFHTYHLAPTGPSFLVFNVCAERVYNTNIFSAQVVHFAQSKNYPPLLEQLCKFVERANEWLEASPSNVIAVHDVPGLTRTGTFIVCWLLYSGFASKTSTHGAMEDAMEWYCLKRMGAPEEESMEYLPSQIRYIQYFQQCIDKQGYSVPGLCLDKIILWTVPDIKPAGGCCPWFIIKQGDKEVFDYSKYNQVDHVLRGREKIVFNCGGCQVRGDVKISFFDHRFDEGIDEEMFFICFHTGFLSSSNWVVPLAEIDGAAKDEKHMVYSPQFRVEFIFVPEQRSKGIWRDLPLATESVLDEAQESSARLRAAQTGEKLKSYGLQSKVKALRSQDRKRFQEDGFDLDLSYITKQIIAMGTPSSGASGIGRNTPEDVAKFFNFRHPNKFAVYMLALGEDSSLPREIFGPRVRSQFGFLDQQPPPLHLLIEFCKDLSDFLAQNPKNVAGISCLDGRSQSGCCICSYLLYSKTFENASQAMDFFAMQRTTNGKGVVVPSQRRYVQYMDMYLRYQRLGYTAPIGPQSHPITIHRIVVYGLARVIVATDPQIVIHYQAEGATAPLKGRAASGSRKGSKGDFADMLPPLVVEVPPSRQDPGDREQRDWIEFVIKQDGRAVTLQGDVKVTVVDKTMTGGYEEVLSVWLHSTFAGDDWTKSNETVSLPGSTLDPARKGAFRDRVLTGAVSVDLDISRAKSHPLQGVCREEKESRGGGTTHGASMALDSDLLIEYD